MKHTAMVPKGFIRYQILESLGEKPMSGSEIMNEIENRTSGRWKPSPGSVYPLLAWFQDNGYVKELPTDQNGLKRYEITATGKALLEEQRKIEMNSKDESRFFGPPFLGALWFKLPPEKTEELRKSLRRVVVAFLELGYRLEHSFSEKTIEEAQKILDETAEKIESLSKKSKVKDDE